MTTTFPSILILAAITLSPFSTNAQWKQANGPSGVNIVAMASIGGTMFAGTENNGVYRTTDSGAHWVSANYGLPNSEPGDTNVYALAALGGDLFVSIWNEYGNTALFRSTNMGMTWDSTNLQENYISELWTIGNNLYAAGGLDSLFRSTDLGTTWNVISSNFSGSGIAGVEINSLAAMGSQLFASSPAGVFISTDNGSNWTITGMLAETYTLFVYGNQLFASTEFDGVFVSTDSGTNWSHVTNGLPSDTFVGVFASMGSKLFAESNDIKTFISSDSGASWHPSGFSQAIISVLDSNLLIGDANNGLFLSSDSGKTWNAINRGLPNSQIFVLGVDHANRYVETGSGFFNTSDNGTTWAVDDSIFFSPVTAFLAMPFATFYGWNQYVEYELNYWTSSGGFGSNVTSLTYAGAGASSLLLASTDSSGIFYSTDLGTNWNSSGFFVDTTVSSMAVLNNTILFVGIPGLGIYKTTDTGNTWSIVNSGLTDLNVNALCTVGTNLFAATESRGVFRSTDRGANWSEINVGLADTEILSLAATDSDLLAGTYGDGIWQRSLSEIVLAPSIVQSTHENTFSLSSYPNPFSSSTQIAVTMASAGFVQVSIVNLLGETVATLFTGMLSVGNHSFPWSNPSLPKGAYECVVRMNGQAEALPIVYVRE